MEESNLITEERSVGDFSSVRLTGIGHLNLKQGEKSSVTVKAPAALIRKIKTSITGDTLTIGYRFALVKWIRSAAGIRDIEFHVTSPKLESISCSGAGNITSEGRIKGETLELKSSGAGNVDLDIGVKDIIVKLMGAGTINLKGTAETQEVTVTGAGKLEAFNLTSKAAMVDSRGSGHCLINVTESLDVTIRGVGRVKYKGQPKINSKITGFGNLESGN